MAAVTPAKWDARSVPLSSYFLCRMTDLPFCFCFRTRIGILALSTTTPLTTQNVFSVVS